MLAWMRGDTEYVDLEACRWVENQFDFHSYLGPGSDLTNIFSGLQSRSREDRKKWLGLGIFHDIPRFHGDLAGSTRGFLRGWNLATAISSVWTMMAPAPWPLPMPTTVSLGWHFAPRLPGWKPWGPRCPSWRLDDWTSKRAIFQSTTKLGTSLAVIIFSSALEAAQENVSFPTFSAVFFFSISSTGGAEDQSYFCREAGCDLRVKAESKLGTPQKMDG